jgi:hypothetical protein
VEGAELYLQRLPFAEDTNPVNPAPQEKYFRTERIRVRRDI